MRNPLQALCKVRILLTDATDHPTELHAACMFRAAGREHDQTPNAVKRIDTEIS